MAIGAESSPVPDFSVLKPASVAFIDMNASSGGIARGSQSSATFTNLINYSGQGFFAGLSLKVVDLLNHYVRVLLDDVDILVGSSGLFIGDLVNIYGANDGATLITVSLLNSVPPSNKVHGLSVSNGTFVWEPKTLVRFESSCKVQLRRTTGGAQYQGGVLNIIKD